MIGWIKRLLGDYGGGCTPYLSLVNVLHGSSLVKEEGVFWFGEWPGRSFVFTGPVSLNFCVYRRKGVDSLSFTGVVCLRLVVVLNSFVECVVVSVSGEDNFFLLDDVFKVDVEVV